LRTCSCRWRIRCSWAAARPAGGGRSRWRSARRLRAGLRRARAWRRGACRRRWRASGSGAASPVCTPRGYARCGASSRRARRPPRRRAARAARSRGRRTRCTAARGTSTPRAACSTATGSCTTPACARRRMRLRPRTRAAQPGRSSPGPARGDASATRAGSRSVPRWMIPPAPRSCCPRCCGRRRSTLGSRGTRRTWRACGRISGARGRSS
jgi:hypothetical protein